MAKTKNQVTVSEKSLQKLINICQTNLIFQDEFKNQIQQQGYEINALRKKIELLEICMQKKRKEEH